MGRDSKYCNKKTIKIKDLREKVTPTSLEDYFIKSIRTIRMLDCL